jgi:disulfide oxidoreductase YuzD
MEKLDEYVELVCKNLKGNDDEIAIMKQEMKNHLLQSVEELKLQGKSQEDSIKIAMDRFGEVDILKNQLKEIYNVQKSFSKKIFNVALVLLFIGILALVSQIIINNNSNTIDSKLLYSIQNIIKNDNSISNENLKTLFNDSQSKFKFYNKELKYIAVYKYPKNYNGNTDADSFKDAQYIYPSIGELNDDLVSTGYIANAGSNQEYLSDNNKWNISIRYITPKSQWLEYAINTLLKIFIITCIVSSLVLFIISAFINIYHNKKLVLCR